MDSNEAMLYCRSITLDLDIGEFINRVRQDLGIHLPTVLTKIVSDYVLPDNPSDYEIGLCGCGALMNQIQDPNEAMRGAVESNNTNMIKALRLIYLNPTDMLIGACLGNRMQYIDEALVNGADINSGLHAAAESGNLELCEYFLLENVHPSYGLCGAISGKHIHIIEYMLKLHDARTDKFIVKLALKTKSLTIVKILSDAGFDFRDDIREAGKANLIDIVEFLLKLGASPLKALNGFCAGGNVEMIVSLINKKVTPTEKCMRLACRYGHKEVVDILMEYKTPLTTAFAGACKGGHMGLALYVADNGAPVNIKFIGEVSRGGSVELTKRLLQKGANIMKAVEGACKGNHFTLASQLIDCVPNNKMHKVTRYLIHLKDSTLLDNNLKARKFGVELGNYDYDDLDDDEILDEACRIGNINAVRAMLNNGMKIYSFPTRDIEILKLLLEHGMDPTQYILTSIQESEEYSIKLRNIQYALANGADIDICLSETTCESSAVFLLAKGANPYISLFGYDNDIKYISSRFGVDMNLVVEMGANEVVCKHLVSLKRANPTRALLANLGNPALCNWLIQNGADPNAGIPIIANMYDRKEPLNCIEKYIRKGADPNRLISRVLKADDYKAAEMLIRHGVDSRIFKFMRSSLLTLMKSDQDTANYALYYAAKNMDVEMAKNALACGANNVKLIKSLVFIGNEIKKLLKPTQPPESVPMSVDGF